MTAPELVQASTAAQAAAIWWARQVGAGMLADEHPVSTEQGKRFAELLGERVADLLGRTDFVSLGVDYGPDMHLAEPAKAAGVNLSRFPWKTHMAVRPDHVVASLGYGSPSVLIWHAPDWQRPVCDTQRYEESPEGRYEPRDEVCGLLRYHPGEHGDWQPDTRTCQGCGQSYVQHYAQMDRDGYTHSWEPGGAS